MTSTGKIYDVHGLLVDSPANADQIQAVKKVREKNQINLILYKVHNFQHLNLMFPMKNARFCCENIIHTELLKLSILDHWDEIY